MSQFSFNRLVESAPVQDAGQRVGRSGPLHGFDCSRLPSRPARGDECGCGGGGGNERSCDQQGQPHPSRYRPNDLLDRARQRQWRGQQPGARRVGTMMRAAGRLGATAIERASAGTARRSRGVARRRRGG
jgi:hypothetical protein